MNPALNPLIPTDVAIIQNHPIHYKHLLFNALQRTGMRFCVVFVAAKSPLLPTVMDLSATNYRSVVLSQGNFESFSPTTVLGTWRTLGRLQPAVVIIGGYHFPACHAAR